MCQWKSGRLFILFFTNHKQKKVTEEEKKYLKQQQSKRKIIGKKISGNDFTMNMFVAISLCSYICRCIHFPSIYIDCQYLYLWNVIKRYVCIISIQYSVFVDGCMSMSMSIYSLLMISNQFCNWELLNKKVFHFSISMTFIPSSFCSFFLLHFR